MADNVSITAGAGTTIATDDAGAGGHVQLVKLAISTDGSATLIPAEATNGLDVDVTRLPALVAGTANIGDVDVLTLPALVAGTANIGDVDVASIAAGDNNIGNVDIVTLPNVTIGTMAALVAGSANIGDVDVLTVPADPFGATADAAVAAGATGSISAKLRRISQSIEDLKTTALVAGTANIGDVDVLTLPALPAGTNNIGDVDVLSIVPVTATTATLTNTNDSATNVTVQASNANREGLILHNDSTQIAYVKFGATATVTSYSVKLPPDAMYQMGPNIYSGIVDCIWAADGSGAMRATEW